MLSAHSVGIPNCQKALAIGRAIFSNQDDYLLQSGQSSIVIRMTIFSNRNDHLEKMRRKVGELPHSSNWHTMEQASYELNWLCSGRNKRNF